MNQYPSIEELIPGPMLGMLPVPLAEEIANRYNTLGINYLTDRVHADGRRINAMMFTDRIENCKEEVVDAVFCMLGQVFLDNESGLQLNDNIFTILEGLIKIYQLLEAEKVIRGSS